MEQVKAESVRTLLGSLNRLILTLYAPGSIYDNQIMQIHSEDGIVCSREAITKDAVTGGSEDISGSISCRSPEKPALQEPTSECCNVSTSKTRSIKRGHGTTCYSCGASLEAKSQVIPID